MDMQTSDWLSARNIRASVIIFAAVATLLLFAKTIAEVKSWSSIGRDLNPSNTITVAGKGEVIAIPDIATFTYSIVEEGVSVKDAQTKSSAKANATVEFLKKSGIEEKDIKTVGYNVYPKTEYEKMICTQYGCPPAGKANIYAYEVSISYMVKVRDTAKAGDALTVIGSLGASNVSGLDFSIDKREDMERDARAKAIEDAKDKAKVLAKDLGVRLVRIVHFDENSYYPVYSKFSAVDGRGGGVEAAPAPALPVGENTISSNVTIVYEIR